MAIALGPIQQAATGTVAANGVMGAGGAGGMQAGTANPGDFPGGGGRRDPRAAANAALAAALAAMLKSAANVLTQTYLDNGDNSNQKCKLFPYKNRDKECAGKGQNAHHAIPDHCWRPGSGIQKLMSDRFGSVGAAMGRKIDDAGSSKNYYFDNMNKGEGLAICVGGAGKTGTHGAIHTLFDAAEATLGEAGSPKYTAKLGDLEDAAAKAMSLATGCNEADLKKQLREYHDSKSHGPDTKLRADPYGKNTTSPTDFNVDPIFRSRNGGSLE